MMANEIRPFELDELEKDDWPDYKKSRNWIPDKKYRELQIR
jgi:hypothetical protein